MLHTNRISIKAALCLMLLCPLTAAAQERAVPVLNLEESLRLAGENGGDVLGAQLDLDAARYQRMEARAEFFPTVSATAIGFHALNPLVDIGVTDLFGSNDFSNNLNSFLAGLSSEFGFTPRFTALQHGYLAGVSAMQPVYAGGRIVNGNRLAELGVRAAGLNLERVRSKTARDVEAMWWQIVSLEDKKATLLRVSDILSELSASGEAAVAAGLAPDTDILELRLRAGETRAALRQLESGIKLAKMALLNSIGYDYSLLDATADDTRPYIDDIVFSYEDFTPLAPENYRRDEEQMLADLVETRLLDLQVEAAELQKKMALGEALPQLALGVSGSYSQFIGSGSANAMAFAMLSVPISDWGKTSLKLKGLESDVKKAELMRERMSSQLRLAVQALWVDLEAKYDALASAEESLEIARVLFDAARANYNAGRTGIDGLLGAEAAYRQAATERTDALIAYRNAVAAYLNPTLEQ